MEAATLTALALAPLLVKQGRRSAAPPPCYPWLMDRPPGVPDVTLSAREVFGLDRDMEIPAFSAPDEHVPDLDPDYVFDPMATRAILAGFAHDRRVLISGHHGTGKSTHIEQVAARLNWPLVRVNLDGRISRSDLLGKDALVIRDGQQVTEFRDGILPWALQRNMALVMRA
jgi:cobaltochelatase CobS